MDASNGCEHSIFNHELTPAKFLLKSQSFEAIIRKDNEPDFHKVKKSDNIESYKTFPMVVQAIKTGSRADRVYLGSSDVDYIYEVGPLVVKCSNIYKKWNMEKLKIWNKKDDNLFFENTENPGFYRVYDKTGKYIEPRTMQTKIAPMIPGVKNVAAFEKPSAALHLTSRPSTLLQGRQSLLQDDEDSVVALKCQYWPRDVWEELKNRKLNHLNLQEIKGNYILHFNYYY